MTPNYFFPFQPHAAFLSACFMGETLAYHSSKEMIKVIFHFYKNKMAQGYKPLCLEVIFIVWCFFFSTFNEYFY